MKYIWGLGRFVNNLMSVFMDVLRVDMFITAVFLFILMYIKLFIFISSLTILNCSVNMSQWWKNHSMTFSSSSSSFFSINSHLSG